MDIYNENNKIEGLTGGNGKRNKYNSKKVKSVRRVNGNINIIDRMIERSSYFLDLKFKYDIGRKIGIKEDASIQKFWDIVFGFVLTTLAIINICILGIYKFNKSITFIPNDILNMIDEKFILYKLLPITILLISIFFMIWVDLDEEEEI